MNNKQCPCCSNHCEKSNLNCDKGREYFSNINNSELLSINELIINNLRKCGHFLHHNKEMKNLDFLSSLSDNELDELSRLLSKICNNF